METTTTRIFAVETSARLRYRQNFPEIAYDLTRLRDDYLSCRYLQPLLRDLVYDAVCDRAAHGLEKFWITLTVGGLFSFVGLLLTPLAADGLDDDAQIVRGEKALEMGSFADTPPPPPPTESALAKKRKSGLYEAV